MTGPAIQELLLCLSPRRTSTLHLLGLLGRDWSDVALAAQRLHKALLKNASQGDLWEKGIPIERSGYSHLVGVPACVLGPSGNFLSGPLNRPKMWKRTKKDRSRKLLKGSRNPPKDRPGRTSPSWETPPFATSLSSFNGEEVHQVSSQKARWLQPNAL